jgi:hypothetical protein
MINLRFYFILIFNKYFSERMYRIWIQNHHSMDFFGIIDYYHLFVFYNNW